MAIIARCSITVSIERDISAVYRFYKLQSSTLSPPSKPTSITTLPPTGWESSEPAYTEGSTNSLYFVDLTVFSDGDFSYSDVSLSSAYEAAKQAYNKATAAQNAASELSPELIAGTQTAATASWTGKSTRLTFLTGGTRIDYMLPFASAANATLNLTLADGSTTGAKYIYFTGTTRLGTQYAAGAVVQLVYDSTGNSGAGAWRVVNPYTNSNTYDRTRYNVAVVSDGTAIPAASLAVFNDSGELTKLSTTPFDTTRPLLYVGTAYTTSATSQSNNYTAYGAAFNYATTKSGFTGTAGKPVYIVGTLNGKMFTPDSAIFTQTEPTTADGKYYMLVGMLSTTTKGTLFAEHPIYQFYNGGFKTAEQIALEAFVRANTAYDSANGRSKIYYSTAAPSGSAYKDGDMWYKIDSNNSVLGLYIFNTTTGSWVQTIISDSVLGNLDAGKITTGTLDASQITVTNLNASNISSGTLDASKISVTNLNADNITSGTISGNLIAASTITNTMLAGSITADKISVTDLQAIAAKIGAINISTTALYSGSKSSASSANQGFYLDKDGKVSIGTDAKYLKWDGSNITWNSGNTSLDSTGKLTTTSASIGGFTIDSTSIYSGSKTRSGNIAASGDVYFGTAGVTRIVGGNTISYTRLGIGPNFAVSTEGYIYAGGGKIGNINIIKDGLFAYDSTSKAALNIYRTGTIKAFITKNTVNPQSSTIEDELLLEDPYGEADDDYEYVDPETGTTIRNSILPSTISSALFELNSGGRIRSKSAQIGYWSISTAGTLQGFNNADNFVSPSGETAARDLRLFAATANTTASSYAIEVRDKVFLSPSSHTFLVTYGGALMCSGAITCASTGTFKGSLTLQKASDASSLYPANLFSINSNGGTTFNVKTKNAFTVNVFVGEELSEDLGLHGDLLKVSSSGVSVKMNTASSGSTVYCAASTGILYRSSSSKRFKEHISYVTAEDAEKLYSLPVVNYKYHESVLADDDPGVGKVFAGLYAEDVVDLFEDAAIYDNDGNVENYMDRAVLARLVKLVQMQHEEIEKLKARG